MSSKEYLMDHIKEGSASLGISGGRKFQFIAQRVIPCLGKRAPGLGYSPLSVEKNDLRKFPRHPEVMVKGTVFDGISHRVLTNARIEIWHRSPKTADQHHRAHFYTDDQGNYRFITDWPLRENGKNYRIFFKITYEHQSFFTKLSFNHSLAFVSSIHKAAQYQPHLAEADRSILHRKISACFQFNIHIPVDLQDLPLHHRIEIGPALL